MKKVKAFKYFFTALLLGALSFSCDIGLGEAVDLTAPQVTIAAPAVSQSVAKEFVITGQASDDIGLRSITVDIEGTGYTEKFQWSSSTWKRLSNGVWTNYGSAKSTGTPNSVQFSIPVNASGAQSGHEYTITTKVTDLSGNEGAKSKDERSIIIDTTEPVVSIIEPVRLMAADDSEFDDYVLQNNSVLPKIKNRKFTISGSQKEDTKLDYLVVYLDTETDVITLGTVTEYPVANPLVKKVITGSNLRNWSTEVSDTEFSDQNICTGPHILRLVTESHDQAGNVEIKSHGWFKFDNAADIPWVTATFGWENLDVSKTNRTYPRCSLQGQAYDDDGLKSISIKVYEDDGVTLIQDYSVKAATLAAEGNPTYKAWSFNALSETKSCVVKVSCTDVNGVTSDEVVRYLTISDVNPPNISNLSPANGTAVLGDAEGKFTFTGQVDDDGDIAFVKIVRIKEDADQMKYFDKGHSGWTNCTSTTAPYVDGNGNKVWMLSLSNETTNAQNRKVRTWTQNFNIFTDFGINGETELLTNQKFIILAQDAGGSANIEAYTLQGDIDPPVISIKYIYVKDPNVKDPVNTTPYELGDEPIELPKPFNRDASTQKISDKIKLSGTWEDNSTDKWSDKTKHGELVLKVSDKTVEDLNTTLTVKTDGTWETGFFTPTDSSVSVITAEMKDWAGNKANASRSYYVNSSTPVLSRIGAETPDGAYGTGSTIRITMEFNKAVEFAGGTGNPVLILNAGPSGNKREAKFIEGNDTSKHIFEYTVVAGDDPVDDSGKAVNLNVTGIRTNGHMWHDEACAEIDPLSIPSTGGTSLGQGRAIVIDTKSPTLEGFTVISGAGWNKANSSIFIQAKFSEDITISPEDLSSLQLKFTNGATTDSATKTGPRTVLFKYVVKSGDTYTDCLQIESVKSTGYTISDIAGNRLQSITTLPNNLPTSGTGIIKVDTEDPAVPQIRNLPGNATVYADSFKFTIDGWEANASERKYTLDGSTWLNYTGEVTVSANGNYSISAYQTDAAGNRSSYATPVSRTLNKNLVISSITAEESDGTYTTGDVINIKLICNENLVVDEGKTGGKSNSYLLLNTTPVQKKAYYLSGSGSKELKFQYTVEEGDSCNEADGLTVEDFVSSKKTDTSDPAIDFSSRCTLPSGNNLADNRTINVVTGAPTITSLTLDETGTVPLLKIKFSNPVSKKAGKYIKISQTYSKNGIVVYNAPAVLTKAQYNNFKSVTDDIDLYYEKGVNGLLSDNATPDLSEKYVLKFDKDGTTDTVREFFRDTKIDSLNDGTILDVFIPIASSKVKMDATDKSLMVVTLSDAYKLPVKGAEYTVTVPAGVAVDSQGHVNPVASGQTYSAEETITLSGVENPVIRVDKSECTISSGVARQPLQAQVKMDCQTPNKNIRYSISTVETTTKNIDDKSLPKNKSDSVAPNAASTPVNTTGEYKPDTALYVGNANNRSSGYKVTIDAYPEGTSVHAKEIAYRSVVRLKQGTPGFSGDNGGFGDPGSMNKVYIRGGDSESGNSTTLGFPLSWNSGDYGKIKMMTQEGDYWYYASWNISVNLYYGFLCGNTGTDDADTMAKGPLNWCWASCSWVGRKHLYSLKPGTSFTMVPVDAYGTGGYGYQQKHLEYRSEATKKSGYGVLVNPIN